MRKMRMKAFDLLLYLREPDQMKAFLSKDQYRLYKLVWDRFVASQMASAILDTMTIDLTAGETIFRANGSKMNLLDL